MIQESKEGRRYGEGEAEDDSDGSNIEENI